MRAYRLAYAAICRRQILGLPPFLKPLVRSAIEQFAQEPYAGKRLEQELSGYLSLRAKRYRINEGAATIEIPYVGHRKDIYEIFSEVIRQRRSRTQGARNGGHGIKRPFFIQFFSRRSGPRRSPG